NRLQGNVPPILPKSRAIFVHWINVELSNITEIGEGPLARDIETRGKHVFYELRDKLPGTPSHAEFATLHDRLNQLIQINQSAMFRADSRAMRMGNRLASEFAIALVILLVIGLVISWALARKISKPLTELSDHLRSFSLRGPSATLGWQPFAELHTVASEFN